MGNGVCKNTICYCHHGTRWLAPVCFNGELKCGNCNPGYEFEGGVSPGKCVKINHKCGGCPNGKPAVGGCLAEGAIGCVQCDPGYLLIVENTHTMVGKCQKPSPR